MGVQVKPAQMLLWQVAHIFQMPVDILGIADNRQPGGIPVIKTTAELERGGNLGGFDKRQIEIGSHPRNVSLGEQTLFAVFFNEAVCHFQYSFLLGSGR